MFSHHYSQVLFIDCMRFSLSWLSLSLLSGLHCSTIDLNPSIIRMLIKFAKVNLTDDSREEEEKCLYKALSILSKCYHREDRKCLENFIHYENESIHETTNLQSIPLTSSLMNARHLNETIWNISDAFELVLNQLHLNINETILKKLFQLNHLAEHHSKILVIGQSQYGKSVLVKAFVKAKMT